AAFSTAAEQSRNNLDRVRELLADQPDALVAKIASAGQARDRWLTDVAFPSVADTRAGRTESAVELLLSPIAAASFSSAEQSATDLENSIGEEKTSEFTLLSQLIGQLVLALVGSVVLLLAGLILSLALVRLWVLRPLTGLQRQLRAVAGEREHETPISASGPPELRAVGHDAEHMRRELVSQLDEARAAREGLAQEGPVVTAIRAQLAGPAQVASSTAEVYGELHPAAGVLAGDWWDTCQLDSHRTAIAVADVSGHGPAAGIAGLRLKTALMTSLRQGAMAGVDFASLAAMVGEDRARCATCAVVVLDRADRRITWANAGHLPPLVVGPSRSEPLRATGPLLSALGGRWNWQSRPFGFDDLVLLGTDGLTESHDRDGSELDDVGLKKLAIRLVATGPTHPGELVPALISAVRHRSADWRRDDATLVAARLQPNGTRTGHL
ncbi:MAG: PP2C family protein-serine/threonine phosphatase, partial [Candidatus Nanopelagicales bacterium]|nr:PP2C family protein-serine/threonine phosphatase [Candidatus Nanopelagicales bacterium]